MPKGRVAEGRWYEAFLGDAIGYVVRLKGCMVCAVRYYVTVASADTALGRVITILPPRQIRQRLRLCWGNLIRLACW